jgi:Na+/H+-dicarboxylate symporter
MQYLRINLKFFKEYYFLLLITLIIVLSINFEKSISIDNKILAFTVSCLLKEILMFIIPFLIFPIVARSIIEISSSSISVLLVITLIILIFLSNLFSIIIPYIFGFGIIPYLGELDSMRSYKVTDAIYSTLELKLPCFDIVKTTLLGIISGMVLSYLRNPYASKMLEHYYKISRLLLTKIFIVFLPLYILGTILKIINEIDLLSLIPIFGKTIILMFALQSSYILFIFFLGSGFQMIKCIKAIKNCFPAFVVGFSSMSSLITLPLTLKAAEINTKNSPIARLVVSSSVNCHDIGDCMALPLIALTIIYGITGQMPEIQTYLLFAVFAALTQFSAASVPGGSIIVLLPILTKYLGFTDDMGILIIAISILIEPIGTAMNVAGNSAFAIVTCKIYNRCKNIKLDSMTDTKYFKQ